MQTSAFAIREGNAGLRTTPLRPHPRLTPIRLRPLYRGLCKHLALGHRGFTLPQDFRCPTSEVNRTAGSRCGTPWCFCMFGRRIRRSAKSSYGSCRKKSQRSASPGCAHASCDESKRGPHGELTRKRERIRVSYAARHPEVTGIYNHSLSYLFDRRSELASPEVVLVDRKGMIVKDTKAPFTS